MAIPPRFIDELRARVTLSDVIRKHVRLTRAGREFKGCCPFHNEKTPSFYVNDEKHFFYCFGCGAGGSAVDFMMRRENQSFPEAVETLAATVGMQVPQSAPEDIEQAKREKSLYTMLEDAAKWMEEQLLNPSNKAAYDYIKERGLSDETLASFRVGYAPADMQSIRKYLAGLGYTDTQMIEGGLLRTSERAKDPYAFFRERIMFPVPDRRGQIVAFGGRALPDHLRSPDRGDFKPPKYINSSDTPLFHKGRMLYGLPHAQKATRDGEPVIVVEGYLDVIATFRAGFRGAVAPLGTALTEDQILILWRMIPQDSKIPILCFDGDDAGRRAAARACERILPLLKPDHSAKIAFLPQGEDPDTLIKSGGKAAFAEILDGAVNLVDFVWQEYSSNKDLSTPEARAGLTKLLDEAAGRIADRTVQHYYREAFRTRLRSAFSPSDQRGPSGSSSGFKRPWTPSRTGGRFGAPPPIPTLTPLRRPVFSKNDMASMAFLACIINNPGIFHEVEEDLAGIVFSENNLDHMRQAVLSTLSVDDGLDPEELRTHLMGRGFEGELSRILSESLYTHAAFAKRSQEADIALEGWRNAWRVRQAEAESQDMTLAKRAFQEDGSPESEERWASLLKTHENSDG